MDRMSTTAFTRARAFLMEQARPLERELYLTHFEGQDPQPALEALADYQNPDGGFGQALEPDYRAGRSSVLATCMALGRMEELGIQDDHPRVVSAIRFLLGAYEAGEKRWTIVPREGDGEPHAPWWNWERLEETFSRFRINPMADVLARLWTFGQNPGKSLVRALLPILRARLAQVERVEPSEIECLLALWQSPMDDPEARRELDAFLRRHIPERVERDAGKWASYCLKPLWAFPDPRTPGADGSQVLIEQALAYEIDTQCEDGAWDPFWCWEGAHPGVWPDACREWRGWLTLRNLKTLRAYDRLPQAH